MTIAMFGDEPIGPRLSARLHREARRAERVAAERPITLRTPANKPISAVVENLSRSGFAMSTIADLGIGEIIGLSIGGALRRRVRVVRRVGLAYGCEFLSPLSDMEVSAALRLRNVVAADFLSTDSESKESVGPRAADQARLSYLARAYFLAASLIILWTAIIAIAWQIL